MTKNYNEIKVKDNMKVTSAGAEEIIEAPVKEKKDIKPVALSAQPKKVKKSLIGRLVSGIVGPDGLPGIGSYVNEEIIKPAIKNIIVDAVTSGINMVMYGDKGGGNNYRGGSRNYGRPPGNYPNTHRPTTNYGANYRSSQAEPAPADRIAPRTARGGVEDFIITDRYDASHVLTSLTEYADRYDSVSVADYYDLIGVESKYTDNNHGWTIDTITRASIVPVRGGYVIKFPPVEVI